MVYEVRETTNSNDPADQNGWWHSSRRIARRSAAGSR